MINPATMQMLESSRTRIINDEETKVEHDSSTEYALLSTTVQIAKHIHHIYDSGQVHGCHNSYHAYFIDGPNCYYHQTNNCLIIEGNYGVPVSNIHTPLGKWVICENSSIPEETVIIELTEKIYTDMELQMICPAHDTGYVTDGPYWLVTAFKGQPVSHPDFQLLPACDVIDVATKEGKQRLQPYLNQLNQFYKHKSDYTESKLAKSIFDTYLATWLRFGLIQDVFNRSIKMLESDELFAEHMKFFKTQIRESSYSYLMSGTKHETILKAIYMSGMNDYLLPCPST